MNTVDTQQRKTTQTGNSELISIRIPRALLPLINDYTATAGTNRTALFITGVKQIMGLTDDNQPAPNG